MDRERIVKFSERLGYKKARESIQLEYMDEDLLNSLWSLLKLSIWDDVTYSYHQYGISKDSNQLVYYLCEKLWLNYFKYPIDTLSYNWDEVCGQLREYFFSCKWFEVYDFIEFCSQNYGKYRFSEDFTKNCNKVLEREMSAYRFVGGQIAQITEKEQLVEIDDAITNSEKGVREHLQRSLQLLADRSNPDYRNSIKESISAIESLVCNVTGKKGTLGQLLKVLDREIELHPGLKTAFSSLYGFTSDESGIRHALLDQSKVTFNDAKFFLVVCSAFSNYVMSKIELFD